MECTIKEANKKKQELTDNIKELLQNFCTETGLKFGTEITIKSFYDTEKIKGKYLFKYNIQNPFR